MPAVHFITHPESAEEVEKIAGPGSVRWAKPPTSPAFLAARSREEAEQIAVELAARYWPPDAARLPWVVSAYPEEIR